MWLRFPIYVDGELRFERKAQGAVSIEESICRMNCVFHSIEMTRAEGRLMDIEVLHQLEMFEDEISQHQIPKQFEVEKLSQQISDMYHLDPDKHSTNPWLRREANQISIWIDQTRLARESAHQLFGG